jgi:hypothetical protein
VNSLVVRALCFLRYLDLLRQGRDLPFNEFQLSDGGKRENCRYGSRSERSGSSD